MRKLLMSLFLLGTICLFSNAQINGYYVKDGDNLSLFADGEPRANTEIGIQVGKSVDVHFTQPSTGSFIWQKVSGSSEIQLNIGVNGRFSLLRATNASRGDSAVFSVTDKDGYMLTITIYVY